jgi:hypothetical protein
MASFLGVRFLRVRASRSRATDMPISYYARQRRVGTRTDGDGTESGCCSLADAAFERYTTFSIIMHRLLTV